MEIRAPWQVTFSCMTRSSFRCRKAKTSMTVGSAGAGDPKRSIGLRVVQAAGHIIPVPWTSELRRQWATGYEQIRHLGEELAYGYTGVIYASLSTAAEN